MKLVSNVILGAMFLTALLGLLVVVGSIIIGEFEFSQVNYINLNGELV